jgi:hypothetical protein
MPFRPLLPGTAAALLVAAGLAAPVPTPVTAQTLSFGPLVHEEGSPLHRVTLTPAVEGVDPVSAGTWQTEVWLAYSNIFEQDSTGTHALFLDLERLITATTVRVGVTPGLELGARFTLETTGGGVLDSFVSGWHEALGVGNANREFYPENGYAQTFRDRGGRLVLDVPRRTFALEDVRLFAKTRLLGDHHARGTLSARGVVRIPTAENRVGNERVDAGLLLLGRVRMGRLFLHGMAGGSTVRAGGAMDGLLRDAAWHLTVAAEHPLASRVHALAQVSFATSRIRGFRSRKVDAAPTSLLLGLAGRVAGGWSWEASFQEDIPPDTPAVDFTFGLGLRRSF